MDDVSGLKPPRFDQSIIGSQEMHEGNRINRAICV